VKQKREFKNLREDGEDRDYLRKAASDSEFEEGETAAQKGGGNGGWEILVRIRKREIAVG
jgi:hypothetical protein